MAGKTISTGTLNLRFMQNAQRAQHVEQVKVITDSVQDETRWEISREIKEAWGIGSDTSPSTPAMHEASYLPFMYSPNGDSSSTSSNIPKLRGRRTWNKRGQEVTEAETSAPKEEELQPLPQDPSSEHSGGLKRLSSISGSGGSSSRSAKDTKQMKPRTKTAHQTICEGGAVGVDLRATMPLPSAVMESTKHSLPQNKAPAAPSFLKPAGVDDPSDHNAVSSGRNPLSQDPDIIHGARGHHAQNLKRERDDPVGAGKTGDEEKKRRKKK